MAERALGGWAEAVLLSSTLLPDPSSPQTGVLIRACLLLYYQQPPASARSPTPSGKRNGATAGPDLGAVWLVWPGAQRKKEQEEEEKEQHNVVGPLCRFSAASYVRVQLACSCLYLLRCLPRCWCLLALTHPVLSCPTSRAAYTFCLPVLPPLSD